MFCLFFSFFLSFFLFLLYILFVNDCRQVVAREPHIIFLLKKKKIKRKEREPGYITYMLTRERACNVIESPVTIATAAARIVCVYIITQQEEEGSRTLTYSMSFQFDALITPT